MLITILCLLLGLLWGWLFTALMNLAGYPMDGTDALLGGLFFGALLFLVLAWMGRMQRRRVQAAAQKLPSAATHSFITLLVQGKQSVGMAVYLCEDCLCLADITAKALPITVYPALEIIRAVSLNAGVLEVHLTEGRVLTFRSGECEAMLSALKERGWLPFQH